MKRIFWIVTAVVLLSLSTPAAAAKCGPTGCYVPASKHHSVMHRRPVRRFLHCRQPVLRVLRFVFCK
jgi:hypothetical protein